MCIRSGLSILGYLGYCVISKEAVCTCTHFIVFGLTKDLYSRHTIQILGLTRPWLEPMIYHVRGEHAIHYTQLPVQSVPITTKVVSSNTAQARCTRYNIYMKNFVSDLWHVSGFLCIPVSSTNKTDRHHITEILLKVALNTITLIPNPKICLWR